MNGSEAEYDEVLEKLKELATNTCLLCRMEEQAEDED